MSPSDDPLQAFQQGLGARIDALEVAVSKLESGDEESLAALRQLATALREQAAALDLMSLRDAASQAEVANAASMPDTIRDLIALLRSEARAGQHRDSAILVIGGDHALPRSLNESLQAPGRVMLHAANAADAKRQLGEHDVVCIVLHLVLPDMDGRTFVTRLREDPRVASIPVLLLADKFDDTSKEDSGLNASDTLLEKPQDPSEIVEWVRTRLRRAPEANKAARRDSLTGLLNRAAFREMFEQTRQESASVQEPLAMAAISADSARTVLSSLDPNTREEILQQLGLRLSNSLRSTDVVARWGAYEFIVLLPGEDHQGAARAIEKVFETVNNESFVTVAGESVKLVLAAGVSVVSPEESLDDSASTCERFVYEAASQGGNKVLSNTSQPQVARSQRIFLLVQDPTTTNVLSQLFIKDGCEVTAFNEWTEVAADALSQQRHHLVILDESLPPGDGFDVLSSIRENEQHKRLQIAMLIESNAEASVTRALEAGVNDYVTRPFSPFTFISRMRRLLQRGARAESTSGGYRILIVDEDVKNLILAASALQQSGAFEVCLARGASDGLSRIEEDLPNAILVDQAIGDLDGAPFLKALQDRRLLNGVSVVIGSLPDDISGSETPPTDIAGTVSKPYSPAELAGQLQALLNVSGSSSTPADTDRLNAEIQRVMGLGS